MDVLEICRQEIRRADEMRYDHPAKALITAQQACERAAACEHVETGLTQWSWLQVDAWSVVASALRSVAELQEAEGALNVALAFLSACPDPLRQARVAQRAAILRFDQQRFDEALDLIDDALAIYEDYDEEHLAAGALADRGLILGRAGHLDKALETLGQALDRMTPETDPRNYLAAVHNTALYIHEVAESPQDDELALAWLRLARRCHGALPESLNLFKLHGLLGIAAIRQGAFDEGIEELRRAYEGFVRAGAPYEQAIIVLHLCGAHLSRGSTDEAKRAAGRLFPVFQRPEIDPEARDALLLFLNEMHSDRATPELVEKVARTVRKGRSWPTQATVC